MVPVSPNPSPPKKRLAVSIVVPVIVLAAILTALVLGHAGWLARQHDRNQARQTALLVAHLVTDAAESYRSPDALQDFVARLAGEKLLRDIVVATVDPPRVVVSARSMSVSRLDASWAQRTLTMTPGRPFFIMMLVRNTSFAPLARSFGTR